MKGSKPNQVKIKDFFFEKNKIKLKKNPLNGSCFFVPRTYPS